MTVTNCCDLGLIRPHRHRKITCDECGKLVLDVLIAGGRKEPAAVPDHIALVLARHKGAHKRAHTIGGNP